MKKRTLLTLSLGTIIVLSCNKSKDANTSANMPCIPTNLTLNVLAFYPFSNGSLNDFSGNGRNLSNTTAAQPGPDRNGNPSCAYVFDNTITTNEWLSTSNTNFLNGLGQFSVSMWYQPKDSSRSGGKYEGLISRRVATAPEGDLQWGLGLFDCRKAIFSYCHSAWDNNITSFNSTTGLDCDLEVHTRTGSWHHVVATYNSTGNEVKVYRDGILQQVVSGANCDYSVQDIGDVFLGRGYTGKIDDVILFNKTLNASEVVQLHSLETCCSEM